MEYFRDKIRKYMEYRFIDRTIKTNTELLEHLVSTVGWLLHYCEKSGVNPPNEYQLRKSIERAQELLRNLPNQPTGNTKNTSTDSEPEPVLGFCQVCG